MIKWCTHCKAFFYIKIECDKLENRVFKNNNDNNNNVNVKDNNDDKFKNKDNDDKSLKKRRRNDNDNVNREIYVVYIIEINISKLKRWIINCVVFQHFIANKDAFIEYRFLSFSIDDVRSIKGIDESKIFIDIEKIRLVTNLRGRKKKIIFNDVFYISELFINFIFQKQLMRVNVSIKLIFFNIEINIRVIIACLKDNNLFYFHIWEKRKLTMILFNFELLMTMLISKQHNIKFVMIIKISIFNIKLALLYIIFKNDVVDKERFNSVDKPIFKP